MDASPPGDYFHRSQAAFDWFRQLAPERQYFALSQAGRPLVSVSSADLPADKLPLATALDALLADGVDIDLTMEKGWKKAELPQQAPAFLLSGQISQAVVESLLGGDQKPGQNPLRRQMLNVAVELLQNIVHHGSPRGQDAKAGIFMVDREAEAYQLISGNPIGKEEKAALQARLEKLNELDGDGLEELYDEVLLSDDEEGSGAGLGLIDMRMRSGLPFMWSFDRLEDGTLFFSVGVIIKRESQ